MSILEKRYLKQEQQYIKKLLQYKSQPLTLVGSASLNKLLYPSDIDLSTSIPKNTKSEELYTFFNSVIEKQNDNLYFIEAKIQTQNGEKLKLHNSIKDNKTEFIGMLDKPNVEFVKLDFVAFDSKTHHFTEVSCIYNLSNKKQSKLDIKRSIASDMFEYLQEKQYYKALKRWFSILRLQRKTPTADLEKLTDYFNSNMGLLYYNNCGLKALLILLKHHSDPLLRKRVEIVLKDLHYTNTNVATHIKKNEKLINKSALTFIKEHYPKLLKKTQRAKLLRGGGLLDFAKNLVKKGSELASTVKDRLTLTVRKGYNNRTTKTIKDYGDKKIIAMQVSRTPINSAIEKVLNIVSLGSWAKAKKEHGVDTLFHLALVIELEGGTKIIVEKNAVIDIYTTSNLSSKAEVIPVDLKGKTLTLNTLLEGGLKQAGSEDKYFLYDAYNNNCQYYIRYLLQGSSLYNDTVAKFLFQDITEVIKKQPEYLAKFAKGVTDARGVADRVLGNGHKTERKRVKKVKHTKCTCKGV